jgi:RNA polymerase sigma-70 factor, ECF subfamily
LQKQEEEKEFEQLIRENELMIHKVCRMYADSNADRDDLFQEIVIQLWKAYPTFRGEARFSTWLYRVAINTAITRLRKERDFIKSYSPAELPEYMQEDHSIEKEKEKQLHEAINRLSQVEKAIVMLYLEDHSYLEMEDILGISQGNLRVKMNRIKEKLRQLTKNN